MKKKRIIALLLSMAMVCGMLGGCGKESKPSQPAEAAGSTDEGKTEEGTAAAEDNVGAEERELLPDGNTYATGLPIVKDKITLRIARGRMPWTPGQTQMKNPL